MLSASLTVGIVQRHLGASFRPDVGLASYVQFSVLKYPTFTLKVPLIPDKKAEVPATGTPKTKEAPKENGDRKRKREASPCEAGSSNADKNRKEEHKSNAGSSSARIQGKKVNRILGEECGHK